MALTLNINIMRPFIVQIFEIIPLSRELHLAPFASSAMNDCKK